MATLSTRRFVLSKSKPVFAEWYVSIDLTNWLNGEQISTVVFSAVRKDTGADATAAVLTAANCTYTSSVVKPFIKGGTDGVTYVAKMQVTSNASPASKDEFYLQFTIDDNIQDVS